MNQKGNYKEETLLHHGLVRFSLSIIRPALDRVSFNLGESERLKLALRSHSQVTLQSVVSSLRKHPPLGTRQRGRRNGCFRRLKNIMFLQELYNMDNLFLL